MNNIYAKKTAWLVGDWGLGDWDWPIPNPQSPIPNN